MKPSVFNFSSLAFVLYLFDQLLSVTHPCVHLFTGCSMVRFAICGSKFAFFSRAYSLSGCFFWTCSECISMLQMLIRNFSLLLFFPFKSWKQRKCEVVWAEVIHLRTFPFSIFIFLQGRNGWNGNWNVTNCKPQTNICSVDVTAKKRTSQEKC